jgi:hypothetical protein
MVGIACCIALLGAQEASASVQGVEGVVSGASGAVAGAEVIAVPENASSDLHTTTAANGSYSLPLAAGTYSIGVTPPAASSEGYFEQSDVVVASGSSTVVNPLLPASEGHGQLSGSISYQPSAQLAGVQVHVMALGPGGQISELTSAATNDAGAWSAGEVPAGTYMLVFVADVNNDNITEATQYATLGANASVSLTTVLTGPPPTPEPPPTFAGTVTYADTGARDPGAELVLTPVGGSPTPPAVNVNAEGSFATAVPAGTYTVSINPEEHSFSLPGAFGSWSYSSDDAEQLTSTVTIEAGQLTSVNYVIPALPVPAGTSASATNQDLGYLNAERARWGLPAGILANAAWSQACAAHDAYLKDNNLLEHPEIQSNPGYSPGGNWAGTHSILAEGGAWTAQANPWEDAPIHLNQLMTPELTSVGIDASRGYDCMTTWPGITTLIPAPFISGLPAPAFPAPLGTVFTYPGNGTGGLPPAEDAGEFPFVPGKFVGIPEGTIAGRELFVYEIGLRPVITAASLLSASGPAQVKWVDANTEEVGGYLTGAIVIPVAPLAANTTYTASVTLEANPAQGIPAVTHVWSFTTGPANPSGQWPGAAADFVSADRAARPALARLKLSPASFRAARHGAAISRAGTGTGTTVSYTDSEAAITALEILRKQAGRTRGHSCVALSRKLARAKPCIRLTRAYAFLHRDRAGSNRFHFSGRVNGHALAPGAYVLQAVARTSEAISAPVSASFRILR